MGAAGYAGGELVRLLLGHPNVTEVLATSRSQAGKRLDAVHPHLRTDAVFASATPAEVARDRDVVFLALEHGESGKAAAELFAASPKLVIDIAADFRIADRELYERYYGKHPAPELQSRFRYALADVLGASLRGATALAAPGCFATAAQLALYPLRGHDVTPALFAITGSSGAGVSLKPTTHHPARAHNVFAYSVLSHRHEGEVLQSWRAWRKDAKAEVRLMVHAGPFVRGIYLTLHARGRDLSPALYREAYAGRPFVRLREAPPELTHVIGTNEAHLHASSTPDGTELQVSVAVDNLVKGAGGQAVQAMNLALGLPETAGLDFAGIYPC